MCTPRPALQTETTRHNQWWLLREAQGAATRGKSNRPQNILSKFMPPAIRELSHMMGKWASSRHQRPPWPPVLGARGLPHCLAPPVRIGVLLSDPPSHPPVVIRHLLTGSPLGTADIWAGSFPAVGRSCARRVLAASLALSPGCQQDLYPPPPSVKLNTVSKHCPESPWVKSLPTPPQVESSSLNAGPRVGLGWNVFSPWQQEKEKKRPG